MKVMITGLLILALMIGACAGSAWFVTNSVEKAEAILQRTMNIDVEQDPQAVAELVRSASAQWGSCATVFGTVLRHDQVDNVVAEFARLEYYSITRDREEYLGSCAALLAQLRHIREMELPTLKNIL